MARIRTIKPELWENEKFGGLHHSGQLLFIGLISTADDEGLLRGHPAKVRSTIFPYDEAVTNANVKAWLEELHHAELIDLYGDNTSRQYVRVRGFAKHQQPRRPLPSVLPKPSSHQPIMKRADKQAVPTQPTTPMTHDGHPVVGVGLEVGVGLGLEVGVNTIVEPSTKNEKLEPSSSQPSTEQVRRVFESWKTLFNRGNCKLDKKRSTRIRWALKEYGREAVWQCLKGYSSDEWRHQQGSRNEIATLFRGTIEFEEGVDKYNKSVQPKSGASSQSSLAKLGY